MKLPKDLLSGNYIKPRIFLCECDKERICQLKTTNTSGVLKFNSYSELSFEVGRTDTDIVTGESIVNPFYDKIEAFRLIEVEGLGYFEIQGPELISDGIKEAKSITSYSLEYMLSTKYLTDFIVNTGSAGSVEVIYAEDVVGDINNIQPVTLFNKENPSLSLLHLALGSVHGWNIGHVDTSLQTLSRQFEIDRASVYDFLINEVCKKFNCYIVFDTIDNTINVYAESLTAKFIGDGITKTFTITPPFSQVGTVSVDGYKTTRWQYNNSTGVVTLEDIPESGAHIEVIDGALTEWETDVFVSFDNLSQEININYDADAIKTCLTVTYGDDGSIREVNLGSPYLTDISYFYTVDWMGQDLYDAYTKYLQKLNSSQSNYTKNSQEILKLNDKIYYEKYRLSLEYSLVQSVNSTTVGTYYVREKNADGSFYYREVSLPGEYNANEKYYSNLTANVTEEKVANLYAVLKKYFNNENKDDDSGETTITSWKTDLDELENDFEFMETYTFDYLSTELSKVNINRIGNSTAETAINNFLSEIWQEIGKVPLEELYLNTYKTIQETNIKAGWAQKDNEKYGYYYPVTLFISSIESAIAIRDNTIKSYEQQRDVYSNANSDISNELSINNKNNFTESQLIRLSAFLREDELHIEDIVETSQDDISSSFKIKQDAMESGKIELQKICQPQLQFSMSMANIYALPEFEPIINQFQLGNVVKVALRPDYIKQSRLLQVNINFDDFSDFSCEFGELTNLRSQSDIHADLLKNAITAGKSVATNSSHWTRGSDTASAIELKIQQGLLDATTQIKAMDGNQGVVIDKYGIHLQEVDPVTGEIDPKQGWIVNNKFLYSDDGFKSTKSVFGEYTFGGETYYGILAESLIGRLIVGSSLEIGNINGTLTFNNNGLTVTNDTNSFIVNPNAEKLLTMSVGSDDIFYIDKTGGKISGWTISATDLKGEFTDDRSNIHEFHINTDPTEQNWLMAAVKENGKDYTYPFKVTKDGILHANDAVIEGQITATTLKLDGCKVPADDVSGLSAVATSGIYDDLSGKPKIPSSVEDLGFDTSTIVYQGDIKQTTKKDSNGISYVETTVPSSSGNITYQTYDADDYIVFGRSMGTNSDGQNYICVSKEGLLTARNALIYGTIYSSAGEIGNWRISTNIIGNSAISGVVDGNVVGMAPGVAFYDQSGNSFIVDTKDTEALCFWAGAPAGYYDAVNKTNWRTMPWKASFRVYRDGTLYASNATINGNITATDGAIGGWKIDHYKLYHNATWENNALTTYGIGIASNGTRDTPALYAGFQGNNGNPYDHNSDAIQPNGEACGPWTKYTNFYVNGNGFLRAKNAEINGKITATSGAIGGWQIDSTKLYHNATWKENDEGILTYGTGVSSATNIGDPAFYAGFQGSGGNPWQHTANAQTNSQLKSWHEYTNFYVTNNGKLFANNADIKGKITATSGKIGGWTIGSQDLYLGDSYSTAKMGIGTSNSDWAFWAGHTTSDTKFRVTSDGYLYAKAGQIAGWVIDGNILQSTANGCRFRINANPGSGQWIDAAIIGSDGQATSWPFYITSQGILHATGANIQGTINATEGAIANWNITGSRIEKDNVVLDANGKYTSGYRMGMQCNGYAAFYAGTKTSAGGSIADESVTNFYVSHDGYLFCNNAKITGVITAKAGGSIGGWSIGEYNIAGQSGQYRFHINANPDKTSGDWIYAAVDKTDGSGVEYPFYVTKKGILNATGAIIKGNITATEGKIGGWTVDGKSLKGIGTTGIHGSYVEIHPDEGITYHYEGDVTVPVTADWIQLCNVINGNSSLYVPQSSSDQISIESTRTSPGDGELSANAAILLNAPNGNIRLRAFSGNGNYGYITLNSENIVLKAQTQGDLNGTWKINSSFITQSDFTKKNSIESMPEKYSVLFDNINPVIYKYNDGTSGRFHTGFIAQDVADAVDKAELTTQDFAAVCYDVDEDNNKVDWGIRYEEFVALNTWQIQKSKARITELENKVKKLEELINTLINKE